MAIITIQSLQDSPDKAHNAEMAAKDVAQQLTGKKPAQIVFFAGGNYDAEKLAAAVHAEFPGITTFGCSTSGEMFDGGLYHNSVSVMAFEQDVFELFELAVLHRVDAEGKNNTPFQLVEDAFAGFEARLGQKMSSLDYTKYVGIILADGTNYFIEPVLDRVGDLTDVQFVGGLSGDDGAFAFTPVFANGKAFTDAVVLVLAKPAGAFSFVKTQGLKLLDTVFTVTKAEEEKRIVNELDGRPAVVAFSEAIGVPVEEITFENTFTKYPFAQMMGEEPFLRVAVEKLPDGSLLFPQAIKEGMRLRPALTAGILDSTRDALENVRAKLGSISAILHFNCMSRHHALEHAGECEEFGKLFKGYPNAGFSSHGEIYITVAHQTSTMLVFA